MFDFFFPQVVEDGPIKVIKQFGCYSVWIKGFEQSGPLVGKLWQKALQEVLLDTQEDLFKNVLILGLGCGCAAKILSQKFPQAKITGVEINPAIINFGKKYFFLDKIPNLKIIHQDAIKFLSPVTSGRFDLVICDLYDGRKMIFPQNISHFLSPRGQIIFNFLKFGKSQKEKEDFINKIKKTLQITQTLETDYNTLFFSQPFLPS